jgi:hypothetical protein
MKCFLKYSVILVTLLLITLIIGELLVESLPNPFKTKNEYMLSHASDVNMLILGSSHTYYGINPEYLDCKSFNLANPTQIYKYDYYLLAHYAEKYKNLNTIIIPISYFSFFSTPHEKRDDYSNYLMNYHIYMDYPCNNWAPKYNIEAYYPTIFQGKIISFLQGKVRNCSDLGFGTDFALKNKVKNAEVNTAISEVELHTRKDRQYLDYHLKYLIDIIQFCKKRSIKLVLITTPKSKFYYNLIDNTEQQKETYQIIEKLKNKYKLPYYNYLKDSRFVSDDFYDADHLSDVGAMKFTKILNEDLKKDKIFLP